ncbi:MAG: DUF6265 family protein [Saprospiraceae bacterium]
MSLKSLLFTGLLGLIPVFAFSQIDEDARQIFRELRALDGVWFMPTDRGDRLEIWAVQDDSTLTGRHVRIRVETGDTVTLEYMTLQRRLDSIDYTVVVRGQNENQPVVYGLTTVDYDGYLFENPEHKDPNKIRYQLLGNREMQVQTEGLRGSRTVSREYVFEREFTPGSVEFRARAGFNVANMNQTGNLLAKPEFTPGPGWELGTTFAFNGRGGFITLNVDVGLLARNVGVVSSFPTFEPTDTGEVFVFYERDVKYRQIWLGLGVYPELTFKRDGKFSMYAGPYVSRLLFNRANGTESPGGDNQLFDANNDFNKLDFGILGGFQLGLSGKKDLGAKIGVRATLGLSNIDNLYDRGCNNPAFCNGRVAMQTVSVYYSINLLKL